MVAWIYEIVNAWYVVSTLQWSPLLVFNNYICQWDILGLKELHKPQLMDSLKGYIWELEKQECHLSSNEGEIVQQAGSGNPRMSEPWRVWNWIINWPLRKLWMLATNTCVSLIWNFPINLTPSPFIFVFFYLPCSPTSNGWSEHLFTSCWPFCT